jgi:2-polyprenyl-3-methyl-5-hydroxy-6-metoxy-1,4-benzoquinol methylase/Zn ribbon nucleic-acid-binding protein
MKTEYVMCNLCGVEDSIPWESKNGINIVQCRRCGLVYSNPRPTRRELLNYYKEEYFLEGNYAENPERLEMYEIEIKKMIDIIGRVGRFLDVGCAYGAFLDKLPSGFEKYGVELSQEAVEFGKKRFNLDIRQGTLDNPIFESGYFDVVHLRGVIEHLQDPCGNIREANRILKDDGWLIVSTTPNIDSPCARFYKERFRLVIPQEHIYYFSPHTIARLLKKAGFKIEKILYPYVNTPYSSIAKDFIHFLWNKFTKERESPPFWRSVMTIYSKKGESI